MYIIPPDSNDYRMFWFDFRIFWFSNVLIWFSNVSIWIRMFEIFKITSNVLIWIRMLEFRSEQNKNKKKNLGKLFRRFYPAFSLCCKFSCHLTSMAANYDYYERKEDELKALKIADKQRGDAKEIKYVTNAETRRSTYSRRSSSLLITSKLVSKIEPFA